MPEKVLTRISEVVEALAGCAKWALDLLSWLTDCLFNLVDDARFISLLKDSSSFTDMTAYLESRNDVSLHLLLCSSTRGFISALCRRLAHLDAISKRALTYYENKAATMHNAAEAGSRTNLALQQAYQKMQRFTSGSLVKVADFTDLVTSLSQDIRTAYQQNLSGLVQSDPSTVAAGQGNDAVVKRAQAHCELGMLVGGPPPQCFRQVLSNLFNLQLLSLKGKTDPAKLFFADYNLLGVQDDNKSLDAKKSAGRYVDVFRRCELDGSGGIPGGHRRNPSSTKSLTTSPSTSDIRWRRCVRCAAVMQNVSGQRPGFTFVLAQQRKCSCGGSWAMLPKDSLIS